jgi:hypothetical protein
MMELLLLLLLLLLNHTTEPVRRQNCVACCFEASEAASPCLWLLSSRLPCRERSRNGPDDFRTLPFAGMSRCSRKMF